MDDNLIERCSSSEKKTILHLMVTALVIQYVCRLEPEKLNGVRSWNLFVIDVTMITLPNLRNFEMTFVAKKVHNSVSSTAHYHKCLFHYQ